MNGHDFEAVILNDYASLTGGSSAVALASASGLAARGVPTTLFTCVGPVSPEMRDIPNLKVICLGQHEIARDPNRLRAAADGLRNRRALAALRELLAQKSPERTLVHVHTWTKALSPAALELVAGLGFRLVVTLHDFFIACPSGGFFVHKTGEICRRRPLSLSCWGCNCDRRNYAQKLWRGARALMQNRYLRVPEKVACFIGVSEFSMGILKPHLPAGVPTHIVRNPVEAAADAPAPVAGNREFLYVGRFEEEKGVRLFAEAVRASGLPATFVGDGALMKEVRALCPGAEFTGWLPPARIRERLRGARALVFPPLWYETLGLVVVEAAAAGVPAVVSDGCAATDFVQHGMNGLRFERGSVEALTRRMLELSRNDAQAERLGRGAYDWYWRDPWTTDRHIDDLMEVYEEIAA